jgi:hypothetical protein
MKARIWVGTIGALASPLLLLWGYHFYFGIWFMVGAIWYCGFVCVPELFRK